MIVGTRLTRKFTQGVVIVPMTFSRYDYLQEIVAGIQQFDKVVKVFCLKAELPIILRRLQQRGTKFDRVEGEWARRKTQTCVDAHRNPAFGEAINTEKLSAAEVAQEILKRL